MGKALQCDLCKTLEAGDPIAKVNVPGVNTNEDWCTDCFASYQDWRATRTPLEANPDDADEDAIDPGDLPPMQGRYQ